MTTPILLQNIASSVVVYLELPTGLPATDRTYADVLVSLKKEGGGFVGIQLKGLTFVALDDGFYEIFLASADTDTLGSLYLSITGTGIKTTLVACRVATAASVVPVLTPAFVPGTTTIFGYLYDVVGAPVSAATVMARGIAKPLLLHPYDQGILVADKFTTVQTDATGFFSVDLLTGTQVEFIIADANYSRVITVPATTVNLFDIP